MITERETLPGQDLLGLLATTMVPEIRWVYGDDLCDCVFQRIGDWTNPYLARTLRVRLCCLWARLYKDHPDLVEEIPAYYDGHADLFVTEPAEWDSPDWDMPRALWYRQMAVQTGLSLAEIRKRCETMDPPKRVSKGG